ncbi:MAG: N-acetylmuramoyl-L-alanine amidase family protein [Solirubrobacteraceae bacterium]
MRKDTMGESRVDDPARVALVLKGVAEPAPLKGGGRGLVAGWALDEASGGAKLTLTLSRPARVERRFLLPPADGVAYYRYVVDLDAEGGPAHAAAASAETRVASDRLAVSAFAPTAFTPPPLRRARARKVIVIDPGHGGKDPGAAGAWSDEKNITLATALALKARLERTGRYQVVMTRSTDVFVPLEERVRIARRVGADLFLSLHADSDPDPAMHGATVYTLSQRGASRVGYVLGRHEWFLQEAADSDDKAVGQILLDLSQRNTRNRSAAFAQTLIQYVGDSAPLAPHSQRDADYFVLLAPDVPAALLEMGFITNPRDEARLNDPEQRAALADRITQAIDAYFYGDSRLAER